MDKLFNNFSNKHKIALIVVGYNRLNSIKRLLQSLVNASFQSKDIPLVISVDCSHNQELYDFVNLFQWPHGEKYVIIQEIKLGLKNHIFSCGDISKYFRAVVILEDDLYVSPYFYEYVCKSLDAYENDLCIAGIALYKNKFNGYVNLPFEPLNNGADVFLMQATCTWGECFTHRMWAGFRDWYEDNKETYKYVDMPDRIKAWSKAWSKYYNAYLIQENKFLLYPHVSLTTNFNESGVHGFGGKSGVQVPLLFGSKVYNMANVESLVKYDIYCNNMSVYDFLNKNQEELCLDFYAFNRNLFNKRYLLTTKRIGYKKIDTYGLLMSPIELNVLYNIKGSELYLYDMSIKDNLSGLNKIKSSKNILEFFYQGFNIRDMLAFSVMSLVLSLFRKIKFVFKKKK